MENYIGRIFNSKSYGKFIVIDYKDSLNVTIRFVDTSYETTVQAGSVRNGTVKDRLFPSVFGVGFLGSGESGWDEGSYFTWVNMLKRCYSKEYHKKKPTYKDCTVVVEWHNYQNFKSWYVKNKEKGLHLDKDIKVDGNRVYGPDTCLMVSPGDNSVKANARNWKFKDPSGIVRDIYNLKSFCRENNLCDGHMGKVNKGLAKSHKGWTKA